MLGYCLNLEHCKNELRRMKRGILSKISSLSPMLENLLPAINSYRLGNNIHSEENPDGDVFRDSLSGLVEAYRDIKAYADGIEGILLNLKRKGLLIYLDENVLKEVILELSVGIVVLRTLGGFYKEARNLLERDEKVSVKEVAELFKAYYDRFRDIKDAIIGRLTNEEVRKVYSEKISLYLPKGSNIEKEKVIEEGELEWPGEFT